jgi:hypothetical protein
MNRTLGPRNVENFLSETFVIYKNNFLRFTAIVAIVEVPIAILSFLVRMPMGFTLEGISAPPLFTPEYILILIPFGLAAFVAGIVMQGAMIYAISEQYFQQPINIGQAYSFAWRRMGAMLGAYFLVLLAVLGLSLTIIGIPAAIYFIIAWVFMWQTALLEGCGPRAALSHSSALVKQSWWRVLGIVLLFVIIVMTINMILYIPLAISLVISVVTAVMTGSATLAATGPPTWTIIGATIGSIIGNIISIPIFMTATTLLYYDLRVRKQGYDLNTLSSELGLAAPTDAVA